MRPWPHLGATTCATQERTLERTADALGEAGAEAEEGQRDKGAQHDDAENAPEQHAVLILRRHGEEGKDQRDDEDVVERQRLLDDEAGEIGHARFGAEIPPNPRAEGEAEADVDGRKYETLADLDLAVVHLEEEEGRERARAWSLVVDDAEDARAGEKVVAAGTPQGYARAVAFARGVRGERDGVSRGRVLGTHGGTHAMHDATVLSGQSGGPLCRAEAPGRLFGVHSFGDAFYGGARDVAVMARNVRDIEIFEKGVDPDAYETKRVNEMIFASSDAALRALAPELTAKERASWIF